MLSPSLVILSETKDPCISLRVNSAKGLQYSARVDHAKDFSMGAARQRQGSFVVPTQSVGTPQDDSFPERLPYYRERSKAKYTFRISLLQFLVGGKAKYLVKTKGLIRN